MASKLPPSFREASAIITDVIRMGEVDIPFQFQGTGAPGDTLEYLCNITRNNADSPDLKIGR